MPPRHAVQRETEMRQNPELRADRFVERFRDLIQSGERQYAAGNYSGHRAARAEMGNMAMSLERDPQMESLLEGRKKQLGIGMDFDSEARSATRPQSRPWQRPGHRIVARRTILFTAVSTLHYYDS